MDAPTLDYVAVDPSLRGWEQVRRIFAAFALAYAVVDGGMQALTVFVMRSASSIAGAQVAAELATLILCVPLSIGAGLTLRGRDAGPIVVRWATLGMLIASVLSSAAYTLSLNRAVWFNSGLARFATSLAGIAVSVPSLLFWLSFPLRRPPR